MEIQHIQRLYEKSPRVQALLKSLGNKSNRYVFLEGLFASAVPVFFSSLSKKLDNTLLFVLQNADEAGYFYHESYRIAPCIPCGSSAGELCFTRGMPLGKPQFVSGLGSYQNRPNGIGRMIPVEEMFHFGSSDIFLPWQEITADPVWEPLLVDSNVEFLRLSPPFTKKYWVEKPDSNIISLCRVTTKGASRYYLYLADHKQVLCSPIPEWMLIDPVCADDARRVNYRLYSNSLLANLGALPPTRYHVDGEMVSIEVRYLFPSMEMNFVKLYSWPQSFYNPDSPFKRVFDRAVFLAVKETLEKQGYCFVEE